jgi:hypothetical protein
VVSLPLNGQEPGSVSESEGTAASYAPPPHTLSEVNP